MTGPELCQQYGISYDYERPAGGIFHMDQKMLNDFLALLTLVMEQGQGGAAILPQIQPYLIRLGHNIAVQRVRKGKSIVRAYQPLQKIVLVAKGEFYLSRSSARGLSSMVARVWAPELLGIPQLVGEDKLFYSNIIASEDCLTLNIDCGFFDRCMHSSPEVSIHCVNCLSRSLTRNYRQIERISFYDASENLMAYLYRKWVENGARDEPLCVQEKRALIADELGCTIRTVCRALNQLKDQGLCSTDRAGVIYCTPEQIKRIRQIYN